MGNSLLFDVTKMNGFCFAKTLMFYPQSHGDSNLDEDILSLADFTPEHLVRCVSKCVRLIQSDIDVPESLPAGKFNKTWQTLYILIVFTSSLTKTKLGIAQRYNVTTALAEACSVSFTFKQIAKISCEIY